MMQESYVFRGNCTEPTRSLREMPRGSIWLIIGDCDRRRILIDEQALCFMFRDYPRLVRILVRILAQAAPLVYNLTSLYAGSIEHTQFPEYNAEKKIDNKIEKKMKKQNQKILRPTIQLLSFCVMVFFGFWIMAWHMKQFGMAEYSLFHNPSHYKWPVAHLGIQQDLPYLFIFYSLFYL